MHTDKPASSKSEDRFQRYEFAKRIASVVAAPKLDKSLIIGLYGKWGEGKTTIMNFIQQELPSKTIIVNFNPWLFSDEQQLLRSFFKSLTNAMGVSEKKTSEKIGSLISDYSYAIGSLTHLIGIDKDAIKQMGNHLTDQSSEDLKKRIDELIIKSGKNIAVFVDDIDRLDVVEIQYVFKLVKLIGDFPRTTYILSFDDEMVSAALSPKYGGNNKIAGYNFLEKIIQVPLKIPKATKKSLSSYTLELLNNVLEINTVHLKEDEQYKFDKAFRLNFLPFMDNPRLGIRYANSFYFSLPLLKGEVNTVDLMIIEGIKIYFVELYEFIRSNGNMLLDRSDSYTDYERNKNNKDEAKAKISAAIQIYSQDQQTAIIRLLQSMFPQLKNVYGNMTYSDSSYIKWTNEKRICSGRYFERYFTYTVQAGDIPDNYFTKFLSEIESKSLKEITKEIRYATEQYSAFDLLLKLQMNSDIFNATQAKKLALALSEIGDNFSKKRNILSTSTYNASAMLIAQLINLTPEKQRMPLIIELLKNSYSIDYGIEILYYVNKQQNEISDQKIFTQREETEIHDSIIKRFNEELATENLFTLISDSNLRTLLSWWSKSKKFKDTLLSIWKIHLDEKNNPDFALKLLKTFIPTINSSSFNPQSEKVTNSTYKAGFSLSCFKLLEEVVDVHKINENLKLKFNSNPLQMQPSDISDRDPLDEETIVSIFQWFIENKNS